jgi:bisphosphoglycerate-dependent phosphoglycerate mutase
MEAKDYTDEHVANYCKDLDVKPPETPAETLEIKRQMEAHYRRIENNHYWAEMADYTNRHWQF